MATKKKLNHSQIVERPREEWNQIFNLTAMSYGIKLTSYKGNQPLVYVPDFISRVTHFKPHCAVICHKRVFDKFDDGIKLNTALAYLRKPDYFPDDYAEGPRSFIKRNRDAVVGRIVSEDNPETLDAYFLLFENKLEMKELDDMLAIAEDSLNIRAYLVERKGRLYPPEKQEQLEIKQQEIDLGLREMTLSEWRAIWSFKTAEDGTIILTGYKGKDTNVDIPANIGKYTVSSLGDYALSPDAPRINGDQKERRSRLQTVTMQEGIIRIGKSAFASCNHLQSVLLPSSLSNLGECVFSGCSSLRDVLIPKGVTSIGDRAFLGCSNLKHVTIPDSVTTIGDSAFRDCSSLTNVTIPEGVTTIGDDAFYHCSSLTSVTIPKGVTSIGDRAFLGCSNLKHVTIPEGVTTIGDSAFRDCSSLTNVTIPEGVTTIGSQAFRGCSRLADADGFVIVNGCLYDYKGSGGDVVIPEGVITIGNSAFSWCINLTSVTIPEGVTTIGDYAFSRCGSLKSVNIPEGVTAIGSEAFRACSSLTSVTIPEGVTSIGDEAFWGCSRLKSVKIPDGVMSIGESVFS